MTKISKKSAYPIKNPVIGDFFVGTDSENNNKTVSFGFEYAANLINRINGTLLINYMFKTNVDILLGVLTQGHFLSEDNNTDIDTVTKLYVNKTNFQEDDLSDLFLFIKEHPGDYFFKVQNSEDLINAVYFKINSIDAYADYFIFNIEINKNNPSFTTLIDSKVYFFSFEIKTNVTKTSDLENDGADGDHPFITADDLPDVPEYTINIVANVLKLYKDGVEVGSQDLSIYLDDTNLARLVSGSLNPTTGIATFTRDDASTFTIDFSALIDVQPTKTSDLTNDGEGTSPFATQQQVTDADSALDSRITVLENYTPPPTTGVTGTAKVIWTGTGYVYDIVYDSYYIDGVLYPAGVTRVTLAASDATNDRIDVFALDATGGIVLPGTPSSDPQAESVDTATQIYITFQLVQATSTEPDNINYGAVYKDNVEWTTYKSGGTTNFGATSGQFDGSACIDIPNSQSGYYLEFTAATPQSISDYTDLGFRMKLKNTWAKSTNYVFQFFNGSTPVSSVVTLKDGSYNLNRTILSVYQYIVIPIYDFDFSQATFNKIRITMYSATGAYLDNIILASTSGGVVSKQKTITSIVTDTGIVNAESPDDTVQIKGINGATTSASGKIITIDVSDAVQEAKDYADDNFVAKDGAKVLSDNNYSTAEKNKLASIDATHYLPPLQTTVQLSAMPQADLSDKARVYVENELSDYFYDATASSGDIAPDDQVGGVGFWRKVAVGGETAASIKAKYESNPDTNALTDARAAKVDAIDQSVSSAEKATWNAKQDALGYTAENSSNKATTMTGNTTSNVVYLSAKAIYDWATGLFQAVLTEVNFGSFINGLTSKTTPVDADYDIIYDSADGGKAKKVSWANRRATAKTYTDTLYAPKTISTVETGTSFTLDDTYHGKIVILTASCTVTLPNGLMSGFEVTIATLAGVTLTLSTGGSVVLKNNTGTTMAEKLSCTFKGMATANNYLTAGGL